MWRAKFLRVVFVEEEENIIRDENKGNIYKNAIFNKADADLAKNVTHSLTL